MASVGLYWHAFDSINGPRLLLMSYSASVCFVFFVCTVTDFSGENKAIAALKFCKYVNRFEVAGPGAVWLSFIGNDVRSYIFIINNRTQGKLWVHFYISIYGHINLSTYYLECESVRCDSCLCARRMLL